MLIGAPFLALLAALGFGTASVLLKRGLQHATPLTAALVSVLVTAGFIWLIAAATAPLASLLTPRILPFLAAGLIAPGLARLVMFMGIDRIGVGRAAPLVGTAPLFSVAIAILALGERPAWLLLAGAAAIVTGGALLSHRAGTERWRRWDLLLPILAALGFALRDNVSRYGFREFHEPVLAAAAATVTSLLVMGGYAAVAGRTQVRMSRAGLAYVTLAGLAEGMAYLTMWRALAVGEVAVVSPLVNAQSIIAVGLAAVFLRDLERVTWRIGLAAALIVAGVTLIVRATVSAAP
ncbi:MAG: DMT family transporter [Candidatus Rokuibacteriota bacterium]